MRPSTSWLKSAKPKIAWLSLKTCWQRNVRTVSSRWTTKSSSSWTKQTWTRKCRSSRCTRKSAVTWRLFKSRKNISMRSRWQLTRKRSSRLSKDWKWKKKWLRSFKNSEINSKRSRRILLTCLKRNPENWSRASRKSSISRTGGYSES